MGYRTDFEIVARGFKDETSAEFFEFKLNRSAGYPFDDNGIQQEGVDDWSIVLTLHDAKFYEYDDVFRELSKEFPDILIEVEGNGEENGDQWQHRFRNGDDERVEAQITFPDFERIV